LISLLPTDAACALRGVLKAELKRAELTYEDLAERMKKHGFKESKSSVASKLSRATVPASFFLGALVAIGCEVVKLEDIYCRRRPVRTQNTARNPRNAITAVAMMTTAESKETSLESLPVDPTLLETANRWFDISWYGLLWAGAFTALSAIATVIFLFIQFWSSGVRERHTEWRTSVVELQTEEAKRDTEEAKERIAQLELQTAVANKRAEEDRLARVKIEQRLADRILSDAQLVVIANKVRQFGNQEYQVTTFWDLKEPLTLANRIHAALSLAGWKYIPPGEGGHSC
jgi:hypothetical protein